MDKKGFPLIKSPRKDIFDRSERQWLVDRCSYCRLLRNGSNSFPGSIKLSHFSSNIWYSYSPMKPLLIAFSKLVGHSMGGSVVVRSCPRLIEKKYRIVGVVVLDVVEGIHTDSERFSLNLTRLLFRLCSRSSPSHEQPTKCPPRRIW